MLIRDTNTAIVPHTGCAVNQKEEIVNELTIHTPELAEALNNLADALCRCGTETPTIRTVVADDSTAEEIAEAVAVATKSISQAATQPAPAAAAPVAPAIPVTAPVAPPTQYTLDQVAQAAVQWAGNDPGRLAQLRGLVGQFGVATLTQLPADQLGAFATAARGLGVQI